MAVKRIDFCQLTAFLVLLNFRNSKAVLLFYCFLYLSLKDLPASIDYQAKILFNCFLD